MTTSALVAACHSKACAPPPIGVGGSTTTRRFDKAIRSQSPAIRQAAEKALAQSIYRGDTKIYHGSRADLKPGDIIQPQEPDGRNWPSPGKKAFATRNIPTTTIYGKKVYEVEPISKDLEFLPSTELGVHVVSGSGFRVKRVVDERPVTYEGPRHKDAIKRQTEIRDKRRVKSTQNWIAKDPRLAEMFKRLEEVLR